MNPLKKDYVQSLKIKWFWEKIKKRAMGSLPNISLPFQKYKYLLKKTEYPYIISNRYHIGNIRIYRSSQEIQNY